MQASRLGVNENRANECKEAGVLVFCLAFSIALSRVRTALASCIMCHVSKLSLVC